jgi:hypothetical protein
MTTQDGLAHCSKAEGTAMRLRYVPFLINGTVVEDHFREQIAGTPLGTVRSSLLSDADLGGTLDRRRRAVKREREALPSRRRLFRAC